MNNEWKYISITDRKGETVTWCRGRLMSIKNVRPPNTHDKHHSRCSCGSFDNHHSLTALTAQCTVDLLENISTHRSRYRCEGCASCPHVRVQLLLSVDVGGTGRVQLNDLMTFERLACDEAASPIDTVLARNSPECARPHALFFADAEGFELTRR